MYPYLCVCVCACMCVMCAREVCKLLSVCNITSPPLSASPPPPLASAPFIVPVDFTSTQEHQY